MSLFKKNERASTPNFESRRHYVFEVPFDELTDDSVVCTCAKITYADVKRELGFGIENADELLAELDAGNSCRKCVKYLERLIEHAKKEIRVF